MRKPPAGQVWCHVDRLDREDGLIWALQYKIGRRYHYDVAGNVIIRLPSYTQFFGPKGAQPKAVVVVPGGVVSLHGQIAVIDDGNFKST